MRVRKRWTWARGREGELGVAGRVTEVGTTRSVGAVGGGPANGRRPDGELGATVVPRVGDTGSPDGYMPGRTTPQRHR
ncbi:hypothetical protein [Modestobacter roseus]|uniref:Uncharacterized protein n=1 Tax=Modestobacter roseus TaxID=1181884 RepID=A0A562IWP6_9ACTN|nr:hypothetical protein [Modestobacter roseus]TWH75387.1 hypothetical protein JD78_03943 [Modestobacter roseus]